jgi:hypothetical protein
MYLFQRFFSLCATAGWLLASLTGFYFAAAGFALTAATGDVIFPFTLACMGGALGIIAGYIFFQRTEMGAHRRRDRKTTSLMIENVCRGICTEI